MPRLHFISVIVLFIATSAFVGLNVVKSGPLLIQTSGDWNQTSGKWNKIEDFYWGIFRGWPFGYQCLESHQINMADLEMSTLPDPNPELLHSIVLPVDRNGRRIILDPHTMSESFDLGIIAFIVDVIIALLSIGVITTITEFIVRKYYYNF